MKVEQSPKADTYVIKLVDTKNIESTVTAFKNPTTQEFTIMTVKTDTPAP